MDQSLNNDSTRKVNLEDLSKDDLVKKCSHLLLIAQKAKQAKTILQEENTKLKGIIDKVTNNTHTATEELIESLTQQKLSLITNAEDLKTQNNLLNEKLKLYDSELADYREKLGTCDNENISYRRRINRLTDENEQLLNDLDALEKQIEKLKEIGGQQQEQLLKVEKANLVENNEVTTNELQRMLSISLEEIKRLKLDNNTLENKVENLGINLVEKDKSIIIISEELNTKNSIISNLTEQLRILEDSKENVVCLANTPSEHEKSREEIERINIELKEKVKLYHSKIIKFATIAKQLRKDKNNVLDLFKAYTDQVKDWKDQLKRAEVSLINHVDAKELEKQQFILQIDNLKKKENEKEIKLIQEQYETEKALLTEKLNDFKDQNVQLSKSIDESNEIIENLREENRRLQQEKENSKKANIEFNNKIVEENLAFENKLKQTLARHENEVKIVKDEFENEKTILETKIKNIEESNMNQVQTLEETIKQLKDENGILKEKEEKVHCDNEEMRNGYISLTEQNENIQKKLKETEQELQKHKNEKTIFETRIKNIEESNMNQVKTLEETIKHLKGENGILKEKEEKVHCDNEEMKNGYISFTEQHENTQKKMKETEQELQKHISLLNQYKENMDILQAKSEKIEKELKNEIIILQNENTNLIKSKEDLMTELDTLNTEMKAFRIELRETADELTKQSEETTKKTKEYEMLISDLQNQIRSLEELSKRSCEEIKNLAEENKQLTSTNETLQDSLNESERSRLNIAHSDCQTDGISSPNDLEEQITDLKRENTELLSEMNEMNQAIKERGENISKLQAHCEEVLKKLQIYEAQANRNIDSITEKEKIIEDLTRQIEELKSNREPEQNITENEEIIALKNEIENLKEKLNANLDNSYADNDTMSTSTISRTEEINRLKDLEGSWEERYGKLRNLAVKLKGKIRELTQTVNKQQGENEELQKKLAINIRTIQNLQSQSDKLEDELENSKKECKQYLNRLNSLAVDISKDKQSLADEEEIIIQLRQELEGCKNEKLVTEKWKKQVSAKIQTLRKEVEANNLMKKDYESKMSKLASDMEAKEQLLKTEIESHKHTKNLLDQSSNECKKNSVLSLEMQDYERSVKETSKKLEKQAEEISNLKGQVESHKTTIAALREQNKLLEERSNEEEQKVLAATVEINTSKKKISTLEDEITQKNNKIQSLTQLLETNRSETEELSTELSKVIAEHQKANNTLKNERDNLRSKMLGLQQSLREVQDSLKLRTDELTAVQNEYEGYKVRAQSVLRQNQSRDVGLEEKMSEEVALLTAQNSTMKNQLEQNKEKIEKLEVDNKNLLSEGETNLKKLKELEGDIEELKNQYAELSAKHEKTISENAETVRSLKVHADTLSQCYRQQISEQEVRHNREIIELQSRLEKAPSPTEPLPVLPTMTREEGEGSESIESNLMPTVHPVPLERLLGSDSEEEIDRIKKKLGEQESKVVHLTALLSDTEQDLVKHVQMNKLLKEEIRRQQRSEEREKHAENLEYLKNVVFKFVTLSSGDERSRLVPVLNTILKLSPEEIKQLTGVAKGETSLKGWTNYLPTWPSPSKPQ